MNRIRLVLTSVVIILSTASPVFAALPVEEYALKQDGSAYEINPYNDSTLWITDYSGEIWQVDPNAPAQTSNYTRYLTGWPVAGDVPIVGNPSDARRSGEFFWWADGGSLGVIGRAAVADGEFTLWSVSGADGFYGTAAASDTELWFVEEWLENEAKAYFYHLLLNQAATSGTLCQYALPIPGTSYYLVLDGPFLWISATSTYGSRIYRLTVSTKRLDWWILPASSDPFGLTIDSEGFLWFADATIKAVARLNAGNNTLYSYSIPSNTYPGLVTVLNENVWFTGYQDPMIGFMDQTAAFAEDPLATDYITLNPTCTSITPTDYTPGDVDYLEMVSGSVGWSTTTYSLNWVAGGWNIYSLPASGAGPWGITSVGEKIYAIDSGNQKLIRIDPNPTHKIFLPLILR